MAESPEVQPIEVRAEGESETPKQKIRVLIAIDGSAQSSTALEWYAKFIHQPNNEVILAHCSDVKAPDYNASPGLMKEIMWKAETKASEIGRVANEILQKHGVSPGKFVTLLGKPSEAIVEAVHERHINMVVIGKRHISKLKKKVSGSVSSHVINHGYVPVLVCPEPKEHGKKHEHSH